MTGVIFGLTRGILGLIGVRRTRIKQGERGLVWREGDFEEALGPGVHWRFDPAGAVRVEKIPVGAPWFEHADLDAVVRSGRVPVGLETLNLVAGRRALVWIDGRFARALGPGFYAWWSGVREVRVETFDVADNDGRLLHPDLDAVLDGDVSGRIAAFTVPAGSRTAFFKNGGFVRLLPPGRYAWWDGAGDNSFVPIDERETTLDIGGQELLTADKLAIRLNASLSIRVADAERFLSAAVDARQALYREAQLVIRAMVGGRDLDGLLEGKERLAAEMEAAIGSKAGEYGFAVASFGIRDIILPGEIRNILIKVTEARKAAEAAMIARREETAAMRHQANTARMLAENPVLMRLRELETVERIASGNKLKFILGEKGLSEKVAAML